MSIKKILVYILLTLNILVVVGLIGTGFSYLVDPTKIHFVATWGLFFPLFLGLNLVFLVLWLFVKPLYMLLPFVSLVVCYVPVRRYIGLNPFAKEPDDAVKIMTYNTLDFHGMYNELDRDDNAIVPFLLDSGADIICLQECDEKKLSEAMYEKLYELYPFHHYTYQGKDFTSLAVYSKYKIEKVDSIACDSCSNISVAYTLVLPKGYAIVVNNHFESNKFTQEKKKDFRNMMLGELQKDSARSESKYIYKQFTEVALRRTPQMRAVAEFIDMYKDMPIILCGDFNEIPISYNYNIIAKHLTDCFSSKGLGFGWTYCHNGMRVRIDNIMCSDGIEPYKCKVLSDVTYSDHYPVVCWLNLKASDEEKQ